MSDGSEEPNEENDESCRFDSVELDAVKQGVIVGTAVSGHGSPFESYMSLN